MTTIRDHLNAKMFKARAFAFACWLLIAAGMFIRSVDIPRVLMLIPFAGFIASVLYMLFFVKCPKCDARLGQAMGNITQLNDCPGCGLDFNGTAPHGRH